MFVAWRDLGFARGRFALMGIVVVLMTLLVVLLSALTAGLGRQSTSAITDLPADHLAFAQPADAQSISFATSTVSVELADRWRALPGVTAAEPLGIATVEARVGRRAAGLAAFGVSSGSPLAPDTGRIGPGRAVLSSGAAGALDVRPGQVVQLAGRRLAVAAVAGDASYSHTPVVWTSIADWQQIAPPGAGVTGGRATVIALTTTSAVDLRAADRRLRTRTVTRADARSAIGSYVSENGSLQLMRVLLFAISALVIGAFFTVWTIQRSGDVAVLKALGATTPYLLRDALGQAVVLLIGGTTVGAGIAVAAGTAVGGAVPLALGVGSVLLPAATLVVLGASGAALAIRRLTSVDPLAALGSAR